MPVTSHLLFASVLLACGLLPARVALAAWPSDPLVNVPLCTATGAQTTPAIISDGAGGAIVAWADARSGNRDIYVQRISADGVPLWTAGGVPLSTVTGDQANPTIVTDGAGGAIVAWHDIRSGTTFDIYKRYCDRDDIARWTTEYGVELHVEHFGPAFYAVSGTFT